MIEHVFFCFNSINYLGVDVDESLLIVDDDICA